MQRDEQCKRTCVFLTDSVIWGFKFGEKTFWHPTVISFLMFHYCNHTAMGHCQKQWLLVGNNKSLSIIKVYRINENDCAEVNSGQVHNLILMEMHLELLFWRPSIADWLTAHLLYTQNKSTKIWCIYLFMYLFCEHVAIFLIFYWYMHELFPNNRIRKLYFFAISIAHSVLPN